MILQCGHCKARYDASGQDPGAQVACACGDFLTVPDLEMMEAETMIEKYLQRLAEEEGIPLDPKAQGNRWEFQRGSARIRLEFDPENDALTIESVIMPLPAQANPREKLFQKILELNYRSTGEARFALHGGNVVVTFTRSGTGLDYLEFSSAMQSVCRTADDYDDELRAEFLPAAAGADAEEEIDLSRLK